MKGLIILKTRSHACKMHPKLWIWCGGPNFNLQIPVPWDINFSYSQLSQLTGALSVEDIGIVSGKMIPSIKGYANIFKIIIFVDLIIIF